MILRSFVNAEPLISVFDSEMDMNRAVGIQGRLKLSQVVAAALRWLAPGLYGIQTPRRSVDRELEQFSSPWG
jgi:hypothetical protein